MKKILLAALLALLVPGVASAQLASPPIYNFPGWMTFEGGVNHTWLNSSSPQSCTVIFTIAPGRTGYLRKIINTGADMTVTLKLWDSSDGSCTGQVVLDNLSLFAGSILPMDIALSSGLSYTLSGPLTSPLYIGEN